MKYNVEELKTALIERCQEEGIYYALVAINKQTKEILLPQNIQGALNNSEYYVFECQKKENGYKVEEVK